MRVLGLDISTVSTGWAVTEDRSLVDYGLLSFNSTSPQRERIFLFGELVSSLLSKFKVNCVAIEDTFVRFDPSVTKKLSRFAGAAVYGVFQQSPETTIIFLPVQSIRSALFPKQKISKEQVHSYLIDKFNLPPNTKNDVTDALAASLYVFEKGVPEKWVI